MKSSRQFVFALVLGLLIVSTGAVSVRAVSERRRTPPPSPRCTDFFRCTLMDEIQKTHLFLLTHKNGLPYTPEARDLQPFTEVVRLNIDTQALGYLNLYNYTDNVQYRREAEARLDAIIALGDQALRHTSFDGQLGYSFLYGYELTSNTAYRDYGLRIADQCLTYPTNMMNWGYMCAMNLGKAYKLTGDQKYLTAARVVTQNTSDKQFPDGAFPHRASLSYGENTGYTSWLIYEMFQYRQADPQNPDMDFAILKATDFLARRVNPDGSLNYEDQNGSYFSDPGNADGRGGTGDLASIGYNLRAAGKNAEAQRALSFLFRQELTGAQRGSYPDKWAWFDPANPWANGNPSVLRTSLIFWYLTSIPLIGNSCQNGQSLSCAIAPDNCNATFAALGLCNAALTGHNVCLNGRLTGCLDESLIAYRPEQCVVFRQCAYSPDQEVSDVYSCTNPGTRRCISATCSNTCLVTTDNTECTRDLFQGDVCSQ